MDELCYGLIVEGPYDEGVFSEFVRKIVGKDLRVIIRPCGGVSKLMTRLSGYLKELEHAWNGKPVAKAIVIRDWQGRDLTAAEQEMAQKVQGRAFTFAHGVRFCAVRQEMETWLLAECGRNQCRGGEPGWANRIASPRRARRNPGRESQTRHATLGSEAPLRCEGLC